MPSENGFIKTIFWTLIIGSFGWTLTVGLLNAKALADEASSRSKEDKELRKDIVIAVEKQQATNEQTSIVLAKILTKLEFVEARIK